MDFFDKDNYDNLNNINNLNKKIKILTIELKEYEAKKKNNIYFLKIQNDIFDQMFNKKYTLLRKYYIRIIKNAIVIYFNKKKNKDLNTLITNNNNNINSIYVDINQIDIFNNIEKKSLLKLKYKYQHAIDDINNINNRYLLKLEKKYNSIINLTNNIYDQKITIHDIKSNNEIFYNYIYISNLANNNLDNDRDLANNKNLTLDLFISIHLYFNKLKLVNLEFLEYIKYKNSKKKQITKLYNNNNKSYKIIQKNIKSNELLNKKSEDIKNKYNYMQKYILIQENKNLKTQFNFVKNIHELNIRIDLHNQLLKDYKDQVENLQNILKETDEIKGHKLKNSEQCMICLEDISYGIITKCNHKFHNSCINLYIFNIFTQLNNIEIKCPICRQFI